MSIYKCTRENTVEFRPAQQCTEDRPPNIVQEMDENCQQRTYAILHEARTEFNKSYLRYLITIYISQQWKIFVLTSMFCVFFLDTSLYTFFYHHERPQEFIILIISLNFIFTIDTSIALLIRYFKEWSKTLNLMEPDGYIIALDTILALPYSFLYLINFPPGYAIFHCIAPVVALLRVYRFIEYFFKRSTQAGSNQWSTFLFQYLTLFSIATHTWTCLWYLFAYRDFDLQKIRSSWTISATHLPTQTTFDWYFICMYWSVMCITTSTLGELYPITTAERIVAMISITLGFILTTIVFVGSLTSQFITITTRRSLYVMHLKKIQNYLYLIKMDQRTTKRIIRYYEDLWYQKSGVFKPKLLYLLPCPLQMEICFDLNAVPLYSSLIFRKLPEAFLRRLSLDMSHQFYLRGDIVYEHNQNKNVMICITNGVLELLSDEDDESPMISFEKGTCFGEVALVYNIPARCTVKAATYVECQVLHKSAFIKLMLTYPDIVHRIRQSMQKRIKRCFKRKDRQNINEPLSLNIYASKERKKSNIKMLKEKLRFIQGKSEFDPSSETDQIDHHCLDLYILSDHIKQKENMFTCINDRFPWILEYNCILVNYWEYYMLILILYICLSYPYFIGFKREFPSGIFFYVEIVTFISLIFNIIMNCVTAIKTKKKYINTIKGIIDYQMSTLGFYFDLISLIPIEYMSTLTTHPIYQDKYKDHLFYFCKGIKLCLIWRISSFFQKLESNLLMNTIAVKIFQKINYELDVFSIQHISIFLADKLLANYQEAVAKYCLYIFLLTYWCGVILYTESCFVSRCSENSWFSEAKKNGALLSTATHPMISSIYFATSLLFLVAYGDFTPSDHYDMALVAFLTLYGTLFTGYCISEFSSVVTHWSRAKTAFLEVILTIDKFMKDNNMHPSIKARIMAFYELQWQYNAGVELTDENWLKNTIIPSELRKKVLHQARFKTLTSIKFFHVKNRSFIHTLTEMVRDIILPPGEIVFYGGTISRELYIIESGYCLITNKELKEKRKEMIIGPGKSVGLLVLLYGTPAVYTVITLTHCKFISISHSAYTSALSLFPDMKEHDTLLSTEELSEITRLANTVEDHDYLKHYENLIRKKKVQFTGLREYFIRDSFINLREHYKKRNENYDHSFKNFKYFKNIAKFILLPYVIKPDGIFLKVWSGLRLAAGLIICIMKPIIVALAPMDFKYINTIYALEIICYIDIFLKLHVAYYNSKKILICHPYMTARNYLGRGFILDFLTSFPWYLFHYIYRHEYPPGKFHLFYVDMVHSPLRLINVLQIYRLYAAFWTESIQALKRVYLMSVLQFLLLTLFFLNLYTSILITTSCKFVLAATPEAFEQKIENLTLKKPYIGAIFHRDGNMICTQASWIGSTSIIKDKYISPSKVFLLAYYWSATSFSGAGFGDITAHDTTHMILSICNIIHGVLFFGYVYGKIASLKAVADQVLTKFQENLKHLEMFLNREKISVALKNVIIDYWKYQWKRTRGWSHQDILGKLHTNLNEDAVLHMYERTLREIPLFENVQNSFFRAFAKQLTEQYFQKGYMIMRSNEVVDMLYIIYRGKVDIVTDTNEVEACIGPGGIFGNIRGAAKYRTLSNIVASRNIDLLSIAGADFYALLKSYPAVHNKVKQSIDAAPKDYVLPCVNTFRISLDMDKVPLAYKEDEDDDDDDYDQDMYSLSEPSIGRSKNESASQTDLTQNSNYISAALLLFMPHVWFRKSLIPDSKWINFMDHFMLFIAYIDFTLLIYQMAFQSNESFLMICLVTDLLFLYKLFLDMHTGYMNRYGDYVLKPQKVRNKFFSKVCLRRRDFLSVFYVCYFAFTLPLNTKMAYAFFTYLRTPQLLRISYVFTFKMHRKNSIGSSNLFVKLANIAIWATILTHVNACVFFKVSCLFRVQCKAGNWISKPSLNLRAEFAKGNFFAIYIASLWYQVNLLTITGTGDVSAQNDIEVIETIIITIITKFCTGLLISEMSALITAHVSSRISYDYAIKELKDGLRDMDLSDHQMNKMWDYVRELWNREQGKQMPELVQQLPFRLRCELIEAIYGQHINESIVFKRTDPDFKRMLAMWMRHCVFFPGNYIVQCGDSDQCIYFIHRGEVEVLTVHSNLTESIYDVLGPDDSFGVAQGIFVGVAHHFSFRARTVVDIVYLKLDEWKYLLDFYPKSAKILHKKVENVYLAT